MAFKAKHVNRFVAKGRTYYYLRYRGNSIFLGNDEQEAAEKYALALPLILQKREKTGIPAEQSTYWRDISKKMAAGARNRSRARGLEYAIDHGNIYGLIQSQGFRCAVSGIKFRPGLNGRKRQAFAPSLDRIDASKGYTLDNIRIVCLAANYALNTFGDDVLQGLADGVARVRVA